MVNYICMEYVMQDYVKYTCHDMCMQYIPCQTIKLDRCNDAVLVNYSPVYYTPYFNR